MKRVWVVDDAIPFAVHSGGMPVPAGMDRSLVLYLLGKGDWTEPPVRELCQVLCADEKYDVTFFVSPELMLQRLSTGVHPPDVVVFDWEYAGGSNVGRNQEALAAVLSATAAFVQVYTHLGKEAVEPHLAELRSKHGPRLLVALAKGDVTAGSLAVVVSNAWAGTIAGEVADSVRSNARQAVESTLIDLCSVPKKALAALADNKHDNLLNLVLARVRDEVGERATQAFEDITNEGVAEGGEEGVRRLLSVWYYFFPMDQRVRRGDIVRLRDGGLGLVVTAPCDLASFRRKTAGRLTWLRIVELSDAERKRLKESGCPVDQQGRSIIASHGKANDMVVTLPNVPVDGRSRKTLADHLLLCHAWESAPVNVEPGAIKYPLDGFVRLCTLAEPFSSAVIGRAAAVILSPALPDLPKGEIARLQELLSAPTALASAAPGPK